MKRILRWLLLGVALVALTACGGGGSSSAGNNSSQNAGNEGSSNAGTQQTRTISGYVVDDPVVGAMIEVYDKDGNLLVREENATDHNGYFEVNVNGEEKILRLQARFKDHALQSYAINDDNIVISPLSSVLVYMITENEEHVTKEVYNTYKTFLERSLSVDSLEVLNPDFLKLLKNKGYEKTLKQLADLTLSQSSNELFLEFFPQSKFLKEVSNLKVSSTVDTSSNFKVLTNTNEPEQVRNTSSLVDAVVVENGNSKTYLMSSSVASLRGTIDAKSTAMTLIQMGLNEYFDMTPVDLEDIYMKLKSTTSYTALVNAVQYGIENNISILENDQIDEALTAVYQEINDKKLLKHYISTSKDIDYEKKEILTKRALKRMERSANTEVFKYPYFDFVFKDYAADSYNGNTEFFIKNPAYMGYGFIQQQNFFDSIKQKSTWTSSAYIPYGKFMGQLKIGNIIKGKDIQFASYGKSEMLHYALKAYNCDEKSGCIDSQCKVKGMCWKEDFIAYDQFALNVPTIYNAIYQVSDIFSAFAEADIKLSRDGKFGGFINVLEEVSENTKEIRDTIGVLYSTLNAAVERVNLTIQIISNIDEIKKDTSGLYASIKTLQRKAKELENLLSKIKELAVIFDEKKDADAKPDTVRDEYKKVAATGNIFEIYRLSKKLDEPLAMTIKGVMFHYFHPKINYKGKEYLYTSFMDDDTIKKRYKLNVQAYVYLKAFGGKSKEVKKVISILENGLKNARISVNSFEAKEVSVSDALTNISNSVSAILSLVNSWQDRGFYVDKSMLKKAYSYLSGLVLNYFASIADEFVNDLADSALDVKKISSKVAKNAARTLIAARQGVNTGAFLVSYYANPKVVPYTLTAIKDTKKEKMKFNADISLKSIGYAMVYLLNQHDNIMNINDENGMPVAVICGPDYRFTPSMEIVFPRGVLKEYLSNTLFDVYDYVYNFKMYSQYNDETPTRDLWLAALDTSAEYEDPNYAEFLYAYYFGNNDAYISKTKAPDVLIDTIKPMDNYEYIDIYDLLLKRSDPNIKYSVSNFDNRKGPGVYKIKLRTTIAPPYLAYIKKSHVAYYQWDYDFKIVQLEDDPIEGEWDEGSSVYIYGNEDGAYLYDFKIPTFKDYPGYVVLPVIDGEIMAPVTDPDSMKYIASGIPTGDEKIDIYVLSETNYRLLDSLDNFQITTALLDKLVARDMAKKISIVPVTAKANITTFNLADETDECKRSKGCVVFDIALGFAESETKYENYFITVDFGDGTTDGPFVAKDGPLSIELKHHYQKSGTFDAKVELYYNVGDGEKRVIDEAYLEKINVELPILSRQYKIKRTGQTLCYSKTDPTKTTDCFSDDALHDDGWYVVVKGLGVAPSYTRDDANDIVIDHVMGLMWQDNEEAKTITKTWEEAKAYCTELNLDGGGWRLPTDKELASIVDYGKTDPSIDTSYFQNVSSNGYWSSTAYAVNENVAWLVDFFYDGDVDYYFKDHSYHVRCVRAGH